jgi:hypothetical protein
VLPGVPGSCLRALFSLRERRDVKCVLRPRLVSSHTDAVTPVRSRLSLDNPLKHSGYRMYHALEH